MPSAPRKPRRPAKSAPLAVWNGPPILAEINDTAALRAADFVLDYPASRYAHAMAALVRQLESRPGSGMAGAAIIAVTTADPMENGSAIAVSLARAAARMGKKSIILDCAAARMATRAMKSQPRTGLYEVLTGMVPLNKALAKDPRGDVYLLGIPRRPSNATAMFSSRPMARLVDILRGGAEFVVVDCGPANSGPDAALIARLADATLLVSRRAALHGPQIAKAARILEGAHAAPIGIVVTN
jgi:Mrp family chromosome partitioning ATPase